MRLDQPTAWRRLGSADHGVLGTTHPDRGPDLVPVVFAVEGDRIFIPIDRVKVKSTTRLRRLVNLESDPRCTLLVEHWTDDWSGLWWVRAHGNGRAIESSDAWHSRLAARYAQYADPATIAGGIEMAVTSITGWAASPEA